MKDRALVIYFVLAYAISWAFMVPVALSAQGLIKAKSLRPVLPGILRPGVGGADRDCVSQGTKGVAALLKAPPDLARGNSILCIPF